MNTVTSSHMLEKLIIPLLVVVSGLVAVVIAVVFSVGLRSVAKLVQSIPKAPAANEKKLLNYSTKIPVNVIPMQETSTDKGELVISNMKK